VVHELFFSERYTYDSRLEGITVPAVLKAGGETVELLAKLDTGAAECFFQHDYGVASGLRVEEGVRQRYMRVSGPFEAFGHEISIEVLGIETSTTAFFYADPSIGRNVLGRRGWLNRIRLGLVDHDSAVYIADYND
jgi:hypothetical protein